MRYLSSMLIVPALLLCGFAIPERPTHRADLLQQMDMTDSMIDNIKEATYWVMVHKDPKAGQYWETSAEAYGTTTVMRWQISKLDGDIAIVEIRMTGKGPVSYDYVTAYKVDLSKETGDANVTKAWIGKPNDEGKELKVMAKPDVGDKGKEPDKAEEQFTDVEMAGKKWSGKKITMKGEGWSSTTWIADDGWFGGMIKTEATGYVTQLSATGTDAKALLKLPEAKAEKKDDKKEDGKDAAKPEEPKKEEPKEEGKEDEK